MFGRAYKHERLMEESERCVEATARSGAMESRLVVSRIIEQPAAYQRWVADHDRLVRGVSDQWKRERQMLALRRCTFGLIHRAALFEYLRDQHVTGERRHRLFEFFHGTRDYAASVVAEHGNFLRSTSSYFCTRYIADELMHDAAMQAPLEYYEALYSDYFRVFCDIALADTPQERENASSLLAVQQYLKRRLIEERQAILDLPTKTDGTSHARWLRQSTGDTVKLRIGYPGVLAATGESSAVHARGAARAPARPRTR
jgi:hypothetical protein